MERYSVAFAQPQPQPQPEPQHNLKPARRKLQKSPRGLKSFFSSKRWSQEPPRHSVDAAAEDRKPAAVAAAAAPLKPRCVSMGPDLSDAKWFDYLDRASLMSAGPGADDVHAHSDDRLAYSKVGDLPPVIPELAHLADTGSRSGSSPHSSPNGSPASPSSTSTSTSASSRRQAKTPVFSIGQLEQSARRRQIRRAEDDAEAMAEQYRALLESRGHEDAEDAYVVSRPPLPALSPVTSLGSDDVRRPVHIPAEQYPAQSSPTTMSSPSDDGTLVAFQEDAIYFKPVSLSPDSSPSIQRQSFGAPVSNSRDNLSLDISLSLLSRQLSSALVSEPRTAAGRDVAALQVWVMIEAYEKLQEQLARMNLAPGELQGATAALGGWVSALYAVHRSLADDGTASDSEYED